MEAILASELDISKVSFGKVVKQTQGSLVNVYYEGNGSLKLQTPLMNTFGMSRVEENGKWTMSLLFSDKNVDGEAVRQFQDCMEKLEEKIVHDITTKYYKTWLNVGDKWDKFSEDMRRELVIQKLGNHFLRHSKNSEKNYDPTMNLKINKKKDSEDLKVDVYMMDEENRVLLDESGEYKSYDWNEHLVFSKEDRRPRPKVYCLFGITIWLVNSNIYLSPTVFQILIQQPKMLTSKVSFNKRGFLKSEDFEENDEEQEDDDELPVAVTVARK